MNASKEILRAVNFAADRHRSQRRKGADASPYINHPIEVAETIARVGNVDDLTILLAAVLHDTVEDTETTFDEIHDSFGPEVRNLVAEVTDDKSLPKAERKKQQVEHASQLSDSAKVIKIADKACNVRDIAHAPPAGWTSQRQMEYLEWASQVVDACRGSNQHLEQYFDEVLARCSKVLEVSGDARNPNRV